MNFDVKETSTTVSNNNKDKNTKPSNVNVSKDATKTYTVNNSNTFVNKETGTIETNANVNTVLNVENNSEKTGAVSSGFFGLFKKVWDIIKRSFTKKEIPKESNVNTKAYKFDESDSYSQLIAETVDADGDGTLEIVDNSKEENELQGEIDRLQWEIDNVYNPKIKELEQSQNGEYNYDTNGDEHVGLSEIFGGLVTQLFTDEEKDIEANEKLKNENLAKINKLKEKLSKLQEEDQINLMNRNVFYRALQLRSDYTENTTESKIADAKKVLGDRALYMTDQEIADFTYLYNVYGEASSNQFIDFYKDAMNQREGFNMAVETLRKNFTIDENGNIVSMSGDILNDTAICSILGFDAGVENFVAGLGNLLKGIHGNLSGEITPEEYKKLLIAQAICEYGGLTEWAYKISQSLGGMVIPIGAGAVAEAYGMDGQGVATLLIFLSSTGNSWKEGLQKGYDPLVAEFYGIFMGSIEAGTERLIGGIPGLDMLTKQTYGVGVKGLMEMLLKSGLSEASEEVVTYVLEGIVDSLFSGEPFKLDLDHLKEMGETAAIAFVTSLIMNGGTLVLKTANGSYNINAPDASNITSKEDIDAFYEAFQYKADLREGKNVKFEDLSLKAQQYILNGDVAILSTESKAILDEAIKDPNITINELIENEPITMEDVKAYFWDPDVISKIADKKSTYSPNVYELALENGYFDSVEDIKYIIEQIKSLDSKYDISQVINENTVKLADEIILNDSMYNQSYYELALSWKGFDLDALKAKYGDPNLDSRVRTSIKNLLSNNSPYIDAEFKNDTAERFLKDECGLSPKEIKTFMNSNNFASYNSTWHINDFDIASFKKEVLARYGDGKKVTKSNLDSYFNDVENNTIVYQAQKQKMLNDYCLETTMRVYEDLTIGIKDYHRYLDFNYSDQGAQRIAVAEEYVSFLSKSDPKYDAFKKAYNAEVKKLGKDPSALTDADKIKIIDSINPQNFFDLYQETNYYQDYVNNVLGKDFVDHQMETFFGPSYRSDPATAKTTVYCIQNEMGMSFTLDGTLGRPEGANVFDRNSMIKILDEATPPYFKVDESNIDDIISGKLSVDIDYVKLETNLDLPYGYLENGGLIVGCQVGVDDVRVTTMTDMAAGSRYVPGMHTMHIPELMLEQQTNLAFKDGDGNSIYSVDEHGNASNITCLVLPDPPAGVY